MLKSPWGIALILIAVLALLFWLILRGGRRFASWVKEPIEPDKPRWTYILTPLAAALAPLAAFSALLPSYLNQQRADSKFMAEARQNRTDAEWYRVRQDTESQEGQFSEAQARFASPDEKTRAVAALQVADLALRPRPGASLSANDENYPHFASTGSQIAVALQMEQSADVRAALRGAMNTLVAFAAEKKNDEWKIALINQLADANRRVERSLIESLAGYSLTGDVKQASALQTLAIIAPFTAEPDRSMIALRDLTKTPEFIADRAIASRLRAATTSAARTQAEAILLPEIRNRAAHLMDVRDTLADALRVRSAAESGAPIPVPGAAEAAAAVSGALAKLPALPMGDTAGSAPKQTLNLSNCFLAGANLWQATLTNADVSGANFTGANLKFSDLTGTNVEKALRLPVSVTRCAKGPDASRLPALKAKYPHFPWSVIEQRSAAAAPKATEPAAAPVEK